MSIKYASQGNDLKWSKLKGSQIEPDVLVQWQDLVGRSKSSDPFLTPQWLLPWLNAGNGRNQLIVAFRRGRLVFLMPIGRGLFQQQLGGFVDSEQQDLALICPLENAAALVGPMLTAIRPAVLRLDTLQKHDAFPLVPHCETAGWKLMSSGGKQSPYIKVGGDWETYLLERSSRCRRKFLRKSREIQRDLSARTILVTTKREVSAWLSAMAELEQSSWKNGTGIFSPATIEQTRQRLLAMAEADQLRLFLLVKERQLMAYNVALFHKGRLWYYNAAFNSEYKNHSPGIHLMGEMIKYGFDYQLKSVELLGGRSRYKEEWTRQWRQRTTAYLFSPGLSAIVGTSGLRFWRSVKTRLKRNHRP
jgi:CelD/BcsL family acetyltransferase involved in cellulose biosynthesis